VYKKAPYKSHGQPDTRHAADSIFAQAGRSRAVLKLAERRKGRRGYRGTITLGVATPDRQHPFITVSHRRP
jgi:hypothetical protein